jgi:hypothetical protein
MKLAAAQAVERWQGAVLISVERRNNFGKLTVVF